MNVNEFLNMGGYASYVWTAYGLALVVLAVNVALPLRRERSLRCARSRVLRRHQGEEA